MATTITRAPRHNHHALLCLSIQLLVSQHFAHYVLTCGRLGSIVDFCSANPGSDQAVDLPAPEGATFLPIEVAGMTSVPTAPISPTTLTDSITAHCVDIMSSDGRRILVEGATALSAIVAMLEGLAQ